MRRLMEAAVAGGGGWLLFSKRHLRPRVLASRDARSGINSCFIVQKQLVQLNSFMTAIAQTESPFNSLKSESIC